MSATEETEEQDPEFEWREPGERRRRTDWRKIADRLRENPGRWALMKGTFSHSVPGFIQAGRLKPFQPPGSFEATMRGATDTEEGRRRGQLYVRYIGEDAEFEFKSPPPE